MTRALVTQMLEALEHGYMVTGAHAKYTAAITAAREYLATEPIPVQSPARKEFISRLREWDNVTLETSRLYMQKAANMLQADAQEIAVMEHQVEILTDELSRCEKQVKRVPMTEKQIDKIHADTARLSQIRTTFFIAFARAIEAHHGITPADKPTGWDNGLSQDYCAEFGQWLASRPGARQQIKAMFDEPEEEDLYALALKADNWGQP